MIFFPPSITSPIWKVPPLFLVLQLSSCTRKDEMWGHRAAKPNHFRELNQRSFVTLQWMFRYRRLWRILWDINLNKCFLWLYRICVVLFSLNVALLYSASSNLPFFPLAVHLPPSHPPVSLLSSFSDSKQPSCCVSPITSWFPSFFPPLSSFFLIPFSL